MRWRMLAALVAAGWIATGAAARAAGPEDTAKATARHRKPAPVIPPEAAVRLAHDAELRRAFFEKQAQPPKPAPVPEFGGYDAKTMSGDGQTGMGFKF